MNINLNAISRTILTITGAALAGPVGSILGSFLGGLTGSALPYTTDLIKNFSTVAARESLLVLTKKTLTKMPPAEMEKLNHDLQTAFRDGLVEGLHDIGGALCFPQAWRSHPRQVPERIFYPLCHPSKKERIQGDLITGQVIDFFRALEKAVTNEEILPLEPPQDTPSAHAQTYLEVESPQGLNDAFFDQNIRPFLARYQSLLNEVTDLEPHLRLHLLDRTLLHLGDLLKKRPEAFRTYNRMSLETLRAMVSEVSEGQNVLLARLDDLLANPQGAPLAGWTESMADLLGATGQVEKKVEDGFDALTERVISQHRELLSRLDSLSAGTARIESKVDRMLRFLDNGGYEIDSQMTIPLRKPPAPGEPPFKGLEYFSQADSELFYGRDALIAALAERLGECPFLAVIGASGSGKSSLVRAGLLPVLSGKRTLSQSPLLPVGCLDWPVRVITPTEAPFLSLATSLAPQKAALKAVRALAEELRGDPAALDLAARRTLTAEGKGKRLLLVVDQFEEIFTQCQDIGERRAFVEALLHAGGPERRGKMVLVIVLRADFYGYCAQYEGLREAVSAHQAYIGPMSREELRQAIEEPAVRNGWKFEPGIVDLMIHDVGDEPGALPLLSHALLETWKNRSGHTMTLESYAESGGVRRAIAKTAEAVYKRLDPQDAQNARSLLLRMIQPGEEAQDTRRRVPLEELRSLSGQVDEVLHELTEARLVTVDEGYAQVAHEALIREWPTLHQWLEEDRAGLRVQRRLTEAALEWERLERDKELLFRGARLIEAGEWADGHTGMLNPLEQEFIERSRAQAERETAEREEQRQRELHAAQQLAESERARAEVQARAARRLRRGAVGLGVALLLAAVFAVISLVFANQAQQNAQKARAGQLAAQSLNLAEQFPQRALLMSLEAVKMGKEDSTTLDAFYRTLARVGGIPLLQQEEELYSAIYAPWQDHPWIAVAGVGGEIHLWDLTQADWAPSTLELDSEGIYAMAFSPGTNQQGFGRWLAAADVEGRLVLWDMQNLQAGHKVLLEGNRISALAFSPATAYEGFGRWLAAVDEVGQLLVWDTNDWAAGYQLLWIGEAPLASVAFSANGYQLAVGDYDGKTYLFEIWVDPLSVTLVQTRSDHFGAVLSVAFSPDGRWLASGGKDNLVFLMNPNELAEDAYLLSGFHDQVYSLAFTPDSNWLVTGSEGDNLRFWSLEDPSYPRYSLHGHEGTVYSLSFSPDGSWLLTSCSDGSARIWRSPVLKKTTILPQALGGVDFPQVLQVNKEWISGIAFSPDGQHLASVSWDNKLVISDMQNLKSEPSITLGRGIVPTSLVFSPDGKWMATGDTDSNIYLWDTSDPYERRVLSGHKDWVTCLAFSPDGRWLASGGFDTSFRLWNMEDLDAPAQAVAVGYEVSSVAFSPDSQWLALALNDEVWIYAMGDLSAPAHILQGHTNFVSTVIFSPDGKQLASGAWDNTIRLWGTDTWAGQSIVLQGHVDRINDLDYSPDGKWLASGSADYTARLWNLQRLDAAPLIFVGYEDEVQSIAFSPDGKWLAGGSLDGTIRLWTMDLEQIQTLACRKAGRNLTIAEWDLYFPGEAYRETCNLNR